jgi:hypothetical protein
MPAKTVKAICSKNNRHSDGTPLSAQTIASQPWQAQPLLSGLDQLLDRLPQQRFTAKLHPQSFDLVTDNLMLR